MTDTPATGHVLSQTADFVPLTDDPVAVRRRQHR
jgi:hypothetical protein